MKELNLAEVSNQLQEWRSQKVHKGEKLPPHLESLIKDLLTIYPKGKVLKELQLSSLVYRRLSRTSHASLSPKEKFVSLVRPCSPPATAPALDILPEKNVERLNIELKFKEFSIHIYQG